MANIKDGPAYDPFPRSGLVKQYEPLIRDTVAKFCKRYPRVNRDDALAEAVLLAHKAADKFDPSRGIKFGTPLILYLRALPKMFEEETGWSHSDPTLEIGKPDPSPAAIYPAGANGTRLLFDLWEFDGDDRKGAVLGIRLNDRSEDYARAVSARISEALKALGYINDDVALGRMRAAIDHMERREREAQQEAEDRARGDYSPTFLPVRPVAFNLQPYKARTPRQHARLANIRNSENEHDPRGAWEESWRLSLGGILYQKASRGQLKAHMSGAQVESMRWEVDRAIAFLRPSLKKNEAAVMGGLVAELNNHAFPITQLAADLGVQERGVYKIRERLMRRISERLSAAGEGKNEAKNNF
jgi:hypothetical protein